MASDQQYQTQLPNPADMESSAAMASTSLLAVQMNNRSLPNQVDQRPDYQSNPMMRLCGAKSPSQQTNQSQFPSYAQIQDGNNTPSGSCEGVQQASKSQLNQSPIGQSLQSTSGGTRHSHQPQFTEVGQSQTFLQSSGEMSSSQQSHPPYTSGGLMHFEETRQPKLTEREPSHDSQKTKSRSGNTVSDDKKVQTKSAIASRRHREKKNKKMQDTFHENELLKMKLQQLQQIQHQSFSAPLASFPRDHHGTMSGEMDQFINCLQMSNDVQEPHRTISSSSAHRTESQENSQAKSMPTFELSKINANDMIIDNVWADLVSREKAKGKFPMIATEPPVKKQHIGPLPGVVIGKSPNASACFSVPSSTSEVAAATQSSASNRGGRTSSGRGGRCGLESGQPSPSVDITVVDPQFGLIHCPQPSRSSACPKSGSSNFSRRTSDIGSGVISSPINVSCWAKNQVPSTEVKKLEDFSVISKLKSDVVNAVEDMVTKMAFCHESTIECLKTDIAEKDIKIEKLELQVNQSDKQLSALQSDLAKAESKAREAVKRAEDLERQLTEKQAQFEVRCNEINEMKEMISEIANRYRLSALYKLQLSKGPIDLQEIDFSDLKMPPPHFPLLFPDMESLTQQRVAERMVSDDGVETSAFDSVQGFGAEIESPDEGFFNF